MNISIQTFRQKLFLVGIGFVLVSCLFIGRVGAASTDSAHDGRLVTFHDRGETRVILTHAQTVRDALSDAHISVVSEDLVEPRLDNQLVATDYTVNIYRARPVIVVDGAIREKVMTAAQTADGITKAAGITLIDEDTTSIKPSNDIVSDGAGVILTVNRAKQFTLSSYGTVITSYSHEATVGEMLAAKDIHLSPSDSLSVNKNTPLTTGMTVSIWRDGVQTATNDEPIPFTVREVQDVDHPIGYHQIQAQGVNGSRSVTYKITTKNGQEVSRAVIQSIVLVQPKEQVEITGIAPPPGSHQDWMSAAGISSGDYGFVSYIVDHEDHDWAPCKVQGGAVNCSYSGSMGYGLVQATPGNKMSSAGSDWRTNPVTQLKWATSYAVGRYGSWGGAYQYWLTHHNW